MKKIVIVATSLLVLVTAFFIYNNYKDSQTNADIKTVEIWIEEEDYKYETNALTLGELIDEVNEKDFTIVLEGDKDDQYGRFISAINDQVNDEAKGVFWLYTSTTNSTCQGGYCDGIDLLALEDGDVFYFTYDSV